MPSHRVHRLRASMFGLSRREAAMVDRFLDFPPGLPHRALHNPAGVAYITLRFGPSAGMYAAQHVLDDLLVELVREVWREAWGKGKIRTG